MDPRSQASLGRIFGALASPGAPAATGGVRLPVCRHLGSAADPARFGDPDLARLAGAFTALEPGLSWHRRTGDCTTASEGFVHAHANSVIAGPGGIERRADLWLGVSLVAPNHRYPDH